MKLRDGTNSFAEDARLSKAVKLAEAIKHECFPFTQAKWEQLSTQSHDWWLRISEQAGVNPPSPATVEATIGMLSQELPLEGR